MMEISINPTQSLKSPMHSGVGTLNFYFNVIPWNQECWLMQPDGKCVTLIVSTKLSKFPFKHEHMMAQAISRARMLDLPVSTS